MSNFTSPAEMACELSPRARALGTLITVYAGTVFTGVTSGQRIVSFIAWTAVFSTLRIITVAVYFVSMAVLLRPIEGGTQFWEFYKSLPVLRFLTAGGETFDDPFFRQGSQWEPPTLLGWMSWVYSTLYTPVREALWLSANWKKASGSLKLVRAIGVAVGALPLTFDVKTRYGKVVEERWGRWSHWTFTLITAGSCLNLGVLSAVLLVLGAVKIPVPWWGCLIYLLVLVGWTNHGFSFAAPHDETSSTRTLSGVCAGLAMGIFGGIFTAGPALVVMFLAPSTPGQDLVDYLRCEPVAWWRKWVAVVP